MNRLLSGQAVVEGLRSSDSRICLGAIHTLTAQPDLALPSAVLQALIDCLGSDAKAVQRQAVNVLAKASVHNHTVESYLRRALSAHESRLRWAAAYTLGQIDGALDIEALPALLEAVSSRDGDVRWAASELVVRLGQGYPREVRDRLLAIGVASDENARKMALYCLRDLGCDDAQVVITAKRAVVDRAIGVRLAALSLLSHLTKRNEELAQVALQCLEQDGDEGVRRAAASALGRIGNRSERVLAALRCAAAHRNDTALARAAQRALAQLERV